ncbi:hypothetical protein PV327_001745 [Microctonus hyperodae]|uniref:Uncharacterized protein n=1 Tax=Microctonus hyperodae TaxID=165561 RepID=A0AA39KND6_MICHY|nr:hypothetical protein PV327_001745 [Microctonus hyperodae]
MNSVCLNNMVVTNTFVGMNTLTRNRNTFRGVPKAELERKTNAILRAMTIEELYSALVYMTQHQIGYDVSNECEQETLLNHLQNAFKIDNETHSQIVEETQNMEYAEK